MKLISILKTIIKAILIWLICLGLYFVFALWTRIQVPNISSLFGVKLIMNAHNGFELTMTSVFPMWLISLLIFSVIYLGIIYWLGRKDGKRLY